LVYRARPIDILNLFSKYSDKYRSILLVGHNPIVEGVVEMLTASPGITKSTCALSHLTLTIDSWTELAAKRPVIGKLVDL
jgi:phosphohistidine phosphatase SixA